MNASNKKWLVAGAIIIFLIVVALKGFFVVRPDQFAIVTEFGEPVQIVGQERCNEAGNECWQVPEPGLHFKIPFIQEVRFIDARVRGWNDTGLDTKTVTNREIDFTAFARWRVSDPLQYYIAHHKGEAERTEQAAHGSMDSIVTTRIQAALRQQRLKSIVRMSDRTFAVEKGLNLRKLIINFEECLPEQNENIREALESIQARQVQLRLLEKDLRSKEVKNRDQVRFTTVIKNQANEKLDDGFGIKVYDLHFKYLNYSTKIHASMIRDIAKDRERDIETYRKIQKFCTGAIKRIEEEMVGKKLAESDRIVRKLRGEALGTAIDLKARTFNQDPEFYRFLQTLELYEHSLAKGTKLIISSNSPLLALMKNADVMKAVDKRNDLTPPTRAELGERDSASNAPPAPPAPAALKPPAKSPEPSPEPSEPATPSPSPAEPTKK